MSRQSLTWPDGKPRFVVRKAFDRRWFVWDMLHERRCSLLVVELAEAESARQKCERAARRYQT